MIDPICRNLTLFSRHVPKDVQFGGGGCLEDFRQWRENCMELTKSRRCNVHTYERGDGYMRTLAC